MGAGKISLGVTLVAQEREMRQVLRGRVMRIKEVGQIQARFRRWNQEGQLGGDKKGSGFTYHFDGDIADSDEE